MVLRPLKWDWRLLGICLKCSPGQAVSGQIGDKVIMCITNRSKTLSTCAMCHLIASKCRFLLFRLKIRAVRCSVYYPLPCFYAMFSKKYFVVWPLQNDICWLYIAIKWSIFGKKYLRKLQILSLRFVWTLDTVYTPDFPICPPQWPFLNFITGKWSTRIYWKIWETTKSGWPRQKRYHLIMKVPNQTKEVSEGKEDRPKTDQRW